MVALRSKSTHKEQEEIEGLDEILSDDEHGADIQNQPRPSKPGEKRQTIAFQESTTRPVPFKPMPNLILAPSISGQQSVGVKEVDKVSPRHASITHKSQRRFLAGLCTKEEYLKLVDAVYQLSKDRPGPGSQSNSQPEDYLDYWPSWASWGYVHSMIPLEIHQGNGTQNLLRWLHVQPYLHHPGSQDSHTGIRGHTAMALICLAVEMLLWDLLQFVDEDNNLTWSYIEFAMVGKTILPFCRDMTTAIQNSLESAFPDKARPLLRMVTRAMQMDGEPRNIAHRTRSGNSPVKRL
ncbi:hypothetical protein SERLADRAFT_404736 [Serpula lacrymans var. lacrymans S7.9]|nr:uncharacterized protein SERLADRAFT_404736 [Serpula lacrymans var. lacrymans S7.9]EGO30668.1 hypothetical protein SERLADRAFT_404736 [Serpula lacrymans var. lacrymans S7.9]